MELLITALREMPRAFPWTFVALVIVAIGAIRTRGRHGGDRLRWHWSVYVAGCEAVVVLSHSLRCQGLEMSVQSFIHSFLIDIAIVAIGVVGAVVAATTVEAMASPSLAFRVPPIPIFAAVAAVAVNLATHIYLVSWIDRPLRYAALH